MISLHTLTPDSSQAMPNVASACDFAKQCAVGVAYGLWYSHHHLVHSYVVIPVGIIVLMSILYGFNQLLANVAKIKFPASVLGLLINLVIMCILDLLATLRTKPKGSMACRVGNTSGWILKHYLLVIKPSMNFTLQWINVFFIPSFIILPLSDHITFVECAKIAGVFAVGLIGLMLFDVYMILALRIVLTKLGVYSFSLEKEHQDPLPLPPPEQHEMISLQQSYITARSDITTIDLSLLHASELTRRVSLDDPFIDPELQAETIVEEPLNPIEKLPKVSQQAAIFVVNYIDWFLYIVLFVVSIPLYYVRALHIMLPYHLALTVLAYYGAILLPARWPQLKKFAHPILVLTAQILFVCFIGSLIYHKGKPEGFLQDLRYYKTGKNYLNLFNGKAMYNNGKIVPQSQQGFTATPQWPGCGDFLSSLMDISIVSLLLPMFTHRRDFVKNFWVLMPPLLVSMAITFFVYPVVCYHIGISSERSIGFIGRSVTLALGTPLMMSLGGSVSLMAVCTILSGILGVLVGDYFFALLRIPSNDFVTRGVTLGINCGAIATAHLLNVDGRAASMSSLSFSIFGTIMIILASIGAIRDVIRLWVGL